MKHPLKKKTTTFVAIELPDEIRESLVMVQQKLDELGYPVVWELPEKLHITLVYLGKIEDGEMKIAMKSVRRLAESIDPVDIKIGYLSYFFQRHGRGTVWIGVDSSGILEVIYKQVVKDLNKRGFSLSSKKFVGHVTLGKLKNMRNDEQKRVLDRLAEQECASVGSFVANELVVMTSRFQRLTNTTEYEVKERVRIGN